MYTFSYWNRQIVSHVFYTVAFIKLDRRFVRDRIYSYEFFRFFNHSKINVAFYTSFLIHCFGKWLKNFNWFSQHCRCNAHKTVTWTWQCWRFKYVVPQCLVLIRISLPKDISPMFWINFTCIESRLVMHLYCYADAPVRVQDSTKNE